MNFAYETKLIKKGLKIIAGVDEAGIGPLAGPVVAAAVVLDFANVETEKKWWEQVRDSKKVSPKKREILAKFIKQNVKDFFVSDVPHGTIDKINILNASFLAMKKSVDGLQRFPDLVLVDGRNRIKNLDVEQMPIIKGDTKILSIAAASILAKVKRDLIMENFHKKYPQYNFVKHKGYPTMEHRSLIKKFGPCPIHRKSFKFITGMIK